MRPARLRGSPRPARPASARPRARLASRARGAEGRRGASGWQQAASASGARGCGLLRAASTSLHLLAFSSFINFSGAARLRPRLLRPGGLAPLRGAHAKEINMPWLTHASQPADRVSQLHVEINLSVPVVSCPGRSCADRAIQTNPGRWVPLFLLAPLPHPRPHIYWKRGSPLWLKVGHISESSLFVNDFWQVQAPLGGVAGNRNSGTGGFLTLRRQGAVCVCTGHPSPGH